MVANQANDSQATNRVDVSPNDGKIISEDLANLVINEDSRNHG